MDKITFAGFRGGDSPPLDPPLFRSIKSVALAEGATEKFW